MIDVSHDPPSAELSEPDLDGGHRATSSGSGAPTTALERNRTGTESPGWNALVRLARLLGREAAQEHIRSQG